MAKPKRGPVREERIHEEVIVEAYGPAERAIGWHYYLDDKIRFSLFQAKCIAPKMISPPQNLSKSGEWHPKIHAPAICWC